MNEIKLGRFPIIQDETITKIFRLFNFEMRNYCIALILNRTLLVYIFDCQRSVEMSHGKKLNNDSQGKVPAKKMRICSYDSATGVLITTNMLSTLSHVKRQYLVNAQVREMLIVIVATIFREVHNKDVNAVKVSSKL